MGIFDRLFGKAADTVRKPAGDLESPLEGKMIRGFEKGSHEGVDIAAPSGTPVKAAGGGIVIHAGLRWHKEYGQTKTIIIRHHDGAEALYCNLSDISVMNGEQVKKGQIIGKI